MVLNDDKEESRSSSMVLDDSDRSCSLSKVLDDSDVMLFVNGVR